MGEQDNLEVLLIGIDAGCLSVFDRLFEEDRTPTIQRLCTEGVSAPLTSQIPPWTPSAWPSLYTGVNPGKHGVTGFVGYDGYDWHVVDHTDVKAHALWSILDRHGVSSVVVNVPVTHPPEQFSGAMIPGFIGPEDPNCHPPGLLEEIRSEIGEYRVYPSYTRGTDELTDEQKMGEYGRLVEMRGAAFRYLLDEYDPGFGFIQFQKTDTVFHEFDGDEAKVNTVYEAVDHELERILTESDPDRVFLASDHGIGEYGPYEFRVNEFLRRQGYVETTNSGKGMPSWSPIRNELREGKNAKTWEPSRAEQLAGVAARCGLTARRARVLLEKLHLLGPVKRVVPSNVARTANTQVDFERSIAYMRARTELGVRINLEGRDPTGVVPVDEYEQVRDDVIDHLAQVTAPDGGQVFETVAPGERYFTGENAEEAVDIVTIPREMNYFLSEQLAETRFTEPEETWDHKMDGVFAATGHGIDDSVELDRPHLFDVTPTILASLGLPHDERMDGTVMEIVEDPGSVQYPSIDERDSGKRTTDEDVEERLTDLGYL